MNPITRLFSAIWHVIVEASTARLSPSRSSPENSTPALLDSTPVLESRLLSHVAYASLSKQAELRPALTMGDFTAFAALFLGLFFVRWLLFRESPHVAALFAAFYGLTFTAASVWHASRYQSLAVSDGFLVGPARTFRWHFVRIPLRDLSLEALDSRSGWNRFLGGAVRFPNPDGPGLWFLPHRYREHDLLAFFSLVRQAQATAT